MLTTSASPRREIEAGVTIIGTIVLNMAMLMKKAKTRDNMEVIVDVTKEARHLPAR